MAERAEIKVVLNTKEAEKKARELRSKSERSEQRVRESQAGGGGNQARGQPPGAPTRPTGTIAPMVGPKKKSTGTAGAVAAALALRAAASMAKMRGVASAGRGALTSAAAGFAAVKVIGAVSSFVAENFEQPGIDLLSTTGGISQAEFARLEGGVRSLADQVQFMSDPMRVLRASFGVGRRRARGIEDAFAAGGDTGAGGLVFTPVGEAFEAARVRDEILKSREERRLIAGRNRLGLAKRGAVNVLEILAKGIGGP